MKYFVEYRYTRNQNGEWYKWTETNNREDAIRMAKYDTPIGTEQVRIVESQVVWEGDPR